MRTLLILIVLLVIAAGGYYWYTQNAAPMNEDITNPFGETPNMNVNVNTSPSTGPTGTDTGTATSQVREINVSNAGMTFNPNTLSVKQGERVRITFNNTGGTHDLNIEGYDVGTQVIQAGQSESFEFTADEAGEFEYYCSVGNHRAMGMRGTLTVTP
jgi:plastocyanin